MSARSGPAADDAAVLTAKYDQEVRWYMCQVNTCHSLAPASSQGINPIFRVALLIRTFSFLSVSAACSVPRPVFEDHF